jgi:hypothetical protein
MFRNRRKVILSELMDKRWKEAFEESDPNDPFCSDPGVQVVRGSDPVSTDMITREDVEHIYWHRYPEDFGDDIAGIFRLKDGRFVYIYYGYDYTFSWRYIWVSSSLENLIKIGIDKYDRRKYDLDKLIKEG